MEERVPERKKIKEKENQIRDAFSLSLEIKSAYQVPERINKKKITYKIHNILIHILNSEKNEKIL